MKTAWSHLFKYLRLRRRTSNWTVSNDSVKRYVRMAGNDLLQKLLQASNDEGGEWKPLNSIYPHIEISSKGQAVRGIRTFDIPLSTVKGIANTINSAKLWDPELVEGSRLQILDRDAEIVLLAFGGFAREAMLRDREFLVYEMRQAFKDQVFVVGCASLPKSLARAVLRESRKRVRGKLELGWVFETMEDNSSCRVTCLLQLNPKGWWPKCWVEKRQARLLVVMNRMFTMAMNKWLQSLT